MLKLFIVAVFRIASCVGDVTFEAPNHRGDPGAPAATCADVAPREGHEKRPPRARSPGFHRYVARPGHC
jgi:hypothetical protein